MIVFSRVKFEKSAVLPSDWPKIIDSQGKSLPEVAVVGRSNVGKSSLLNDLFTKKLVRTSAAPGKTQLINFFSVDQQLVFVDLPGYGFAEVPLSVKAQWGPMVRSYLEQRETLKLLVLLLDIRRIPNEDDLQLIEWCRYYEKPWILVLTKIDKVNQSDQVRNMRKIAEIVDLNQVPYVPYSVPKRRGRDVLIRLITQSLGKPL